MQATMLPPQLLALTMFLSRLRRWSLSQGGHGDTDVPFVTECFTDTHFLPSNQLWVSVLITVHYMKKVLCWGLKMCLSIPFIESHWEPVPGQRLGELPPCLHVGNAKVSLRVSFSLGFQNKHLQTKLAWKLGKLGCSPKRLWMKTPDA